MGKKYKKVRSFCSWESKLQRLKFTQNIFSLPRCLSSHPSITNFANSPHCTSHPFPSLVPFSCSFSLPNVNLPSFRHITNLISWSIDWPLSSSTLHYREVSYQFIAITILLDREIYKIPYNVKIIVPMVPYLSFLSVHFSFVVTFNDVYNIHTTYWCTQPYISW